METPRPSDRRLMTGGRLGGRGLQPEPGGGQQGAVMPVGGGPDDPVGLGRTHLFAWLQIGQAAAVHPDLDTCMGEGIDQLSHREPGFIGGTHRCPDQGSGRASGSDAIRVVTSGAPSRGAAGGAVGLVG